MNMTMEIEITINGKRHELSVPPHRLLSELLREDLGLTGTKEACGMGDCGACTVLLEGREHRRRTAARAGRSSRCTEWRVHKVTPISKAVSTDRAPQAASATRPADDRGEPTTRGQTCGFASPRAATRRAAPASSVPPSQFRDRVAHVLWTWGKR